MSVRLVYVQPVVVSSSVIAQCHYSTVALPLAEVQRLHTHRQACGYVAPSASAACVTHRPAGFFLRRTAAYAHVHTGTTK